MVKFRRLGALALACLFVVAGCGGGGGGADGDTPRFDATFDHPSLSVTGVEGTPEAANIVATLSYTGGAPGDKLYLEAEADQAVVLDIKGGTSGNVLSATITLRGDLAPGNYSTVFKLHACVDQACTTEVAGSPVSLPIVYKLVPNLQVQQDLALSRSGDEAAPGVTLPVTIPAEAGTVTMQAQNGRPDAIGLSFDGSAVQVQTSQVPAGSYSAKVTLQSTSDVRYSRTIDIAYTVAPPPGGERPLAVADGPRYLYLQQGTKSVQHVLVQRPTWTSAWDAPRIVGDANHILSLVDLGDGTYDATFDAAGLAPGQYEAAIVFSAGSTGGTAFVTFSVSVSSSFYFGGDMSRTLNATSTAADLAWTGSVLTFDGVPARWTATSPSPLLHVVRSSGTTGVDALELAIDPAALHLIDWGLALPLEVGIDRPGVLPIAFQFSLYNNIPALGRISPATLVGSAGRVYIEGALRVFEANPMQGGHLHVSGATLDNAQLIADTRYLGELNVLAIDLSGATPGQPVTISVDSPLLPTQLQVQVLAPARSTAAYQALAFGSYRAPQFAPGLDALYFAGNETVHRWAHGSSGWTMTQTALPGLIDAAPSPDAATLYAIDAARVIALDPVTLAQRSTGLLFSDFGEQPAFDAQAAAGLRAFAFSADGRAVGSVKSLASPSSRGVDIICAGEGGRLPLPLTGGPTLCDPGGRFGASDDSTGAALIRSANGHVVVAVLPGGARRIYRASDRFWVDAPKLPQGLQLAAVSDTGKRFVRSDGMLLDGNDNQLGNLASVVPFTHVGGGFGLSSGGRFGVIYGYRINGTGDAQRATDATIWVVDLNDVASAGVSSAPVVATIAMPDAVGCTGVLTTGEACQHTASILIAPGDGTAFVLGPRGVASIPLPVSVTAAQPLSIRKRASALSGTVRTPLWGVGK